MGNVNLSRADELTEWKESNVHNSPNSFKVKSSESGQVINDIDHWKKVLSQSNPEKFSEFQQQKNSWDQQSPLIFDVSSKIKNQKKTNPQKSVEELEKEYKQFEDHINNTFDEDAELAKFEAEMGLDKFEEESDEKPLKTSPEFEYMKDIVLNDGKNISEIEKKHKLENSHSDNTSHSDEIDDEDEELLNFEKNIHRPSILNELDDLEKKGRLDPKIDKNNFFKDVPYSIGEKRNSKKPKKNQKKPKKQLMGPKKKINKKKPVPPRVGRPSLLEITPSPRPSLVTDDMDDEEKELAMFEEEAIAFEEKQWDKRKGRKRGPNNNEKVNEKMRKEKERIRLQAIENERIIEETEKKLLAESERKRKMAEKQKMRKKFNSERRKLSESKINEKRAREIRKKDDLKMQKRARIEEEKKRDHERMEREIKMKKRRKTKTIGEMEEESEVEKELKRIELERKRNIRAKKRKMRKMGGSAPSRKKKPPPKVPRSLKRGPKSQKKKIILPNGDIYTGDVIKNDVPHGNGVLLIKKTSERYVGKFSNGRKHGKAILYSASNKVIFDGLYSNDRFFKGTRVYPNNEKYSGQFNRNNDFDGFGTYFYSGNPEFSQYSGFWKGGQKNGNAKLYYKDGSYMECVFQKNLLVQVVKCVFLPTFKGKKK